MIWPSQIVIFNLLLFLSNQISTVELNDINSSSSSQSAAQTTTTTTMTTTAISATKKPICNMFQPCGWKVFRFSEQFRKIPLYFVHSSCQCSKSETCVHDSDDMSIQSFVYRCKSKIK